MTEADDARQRLIAIGEGFRRRSGAEPCDNITAPPALKISAIKPTIP